MGHQLPLPLTWARSLAGADYLVTDANADAVRVLDGWQSWPVPACLLIGPAGSGKSHLAGLFVARSGAELVEDADRRDPEPLFHAWNRALASRRPLLLTAREQPARWPGMLPDLLSRLGASPRAVLGAPDDALLRGVLVKQFADRGLTVVPAVVDWLAARVERSFAGAAAAVDALDVVALAERRAVTLPLARAVINQRQSFVART